MSNNPVRILFVDDEPLWLKSLQRTLKAKHVPYLMDFVTDGYEAIQKLEQDEYTVLVTDYHMPCLGGNNLLSHVKKKFPQVVCIMLSGAIDEKIHNSEHQDVQFLSKHETVETLLETIEKSLSISKLLRDDEFSNLLKSLNSISNLPEMSFQISPRNLEQGRKDGIARFSCDSLGIEFQIQFENPENAATETLSASS